MKKLFLLVLVVFVGVFALVGVWLYSNSKPVSSSTATKNFLIDKGSSANQIGSKLETSGLIRNAFAFRLYTHLMGVSGKIVSGEFALSPDMSLFQVVDQLLKGPTEVWVTIPEGFRREEIATRFATVLNENNSFITDFMGLSGNDEGMLFPDSYLFPKDVSAQTVVNKLVQTFKDKTSSLKLSNNLSFNQSVVLASILERETKTDAERPVVAGILINRLNAGMPLQVDATVQYAEATSRCRYTIISCQWWQPPTRAELELNSQYNTYKVTGLPPGPISNPGISSLEAAFNPTPSDYYYYIHDAGGQIHYAKTLEEQNANIAKYLQ